MKDLWRAEVILVGSFPITLFLTLESYDLYRYFNNGLNPAYAPWPFNTGGAAQPVGRRSRRGSSCLPSRLSLTVAVIDFLIGRWNATSKKP